jgi:pyrroloquinoline-quinone synthase
MLPYLARSIVYSQKLMSHTETTQDPLLFEADFIAGFHAIGEERYHHKHPFHLLMHEGKLTRGQLQAWALNRYYYQSRIPIKDAAILARSEDPAFRLAWRKRIIDHDGDGFRPGGIEKWLRLVEATGLSRQQALQGDGILPATRYAVQAYVDFVSTRSHLEAVASSLTEMFSKKLITLRVDRLREHYPWLSSGLDYFTGRMTQAPEDADFALAYVVKHAKTREQQDATLNALRAKCDILWAQLDALYFSYVNPGWPPPGAFVPAKESQ